MCSFSIDYAKAWPLNRERYQLPGKSRGLVRRRGHRAVVRAIAWQLRAVAGQVEGLAREASNRTAAGRLRVVGRLSADRLTETTVPLKRARSRRFAYISPALSPIIDQKDTRSVVSSLVRAVHRHALKLCAEVTLKHHAVRFVSGSINSGNQA